MRNTSPSRSEGDAGAKRTQGMPGVAGRRHCSALPPSFRECATVSPNRPTTTRLARQSALPSTYEVRQLPVWPEIEQLRLESRGSRHKFWISIEEEPKLWLLKFPRPNTGEHWAEKIAAEVGRLIEVDCARVELADCGGELVTICESFDSGNRDEQHEHVDELRDWFYDETILVEGCYVLAWNDDQYDVETRFGQRDHNVSNIIRAVKGLFRDPSFPAGGRVDDILQALASYAMLDGLIGNTDRHHENWTLQIVLVHASATAWMSAAPSYDHASSLGRELHDQSRKRILDTDGVLNYVNRGHGGVFGDGGQNRAPSPLDTAKYISQRWPEYTQATLQRIGETPDSEFRTAIDRVPTEFMGDIAKEFAYQIIVTSKNELLKRTQ